MNKLEIATKDLILDKIIGPTFWEGDTYTDQKRLENMETAYELLLPLLSGIYNNATLAPNAIATASGEMLNKRAKAMVAYIKDICDEVEQ